MRGALRALPALLAAVSLAGCPGPGEGSKKSGAARRVAPGNSLNVLLITIDTLRADHLGVYGYRHRTSPRIDALARRGVVFDQAYTYWPKTRGSFVAIMTGRLASQTGYGKTHPLLLDFNPTLASVLKDAGYETAATVDNPNVASSLGYAKGFDTYRETWEEKRLVTKMDRARAITADGVRRLRAASPEKPFFLWLHYVNPHAPYEPPAPWDGAFFDPEAAHGPALRAVEGFHGGVPKPWAVAGKPLGWYVARYDGEIAAVDAEVGQLVGALDASPVRDGTLVVVASDHGESLGEHDYYFDHGEDLFDPSIRIPLIAVGPGIPSGRRSDLLATTLDIVPTVLDAVKVSYPPDLAGVSLLPAARGEQRPDRRRLQGQNDRNLLAAWDRRFKVVATPLGEGARYALYDRQADPGETRDASADWQERASEERGAIELFRGKIDSQMASTRRLLEGRSGEERLSAEACEKLKAMGYVQRGCP